MLIIPLFQSAVMAGEEDDCVMTRLSMDVPDVLQNDAQAKQRASVIKHL